MRATRILWNTLRQAPAGVDLPGQQLLLRAGLLRSPAPAVWTLLPLGQQGWERLLACTVRVAREAGARPVSFPWARPPESESGRNARWRYGEPAGWAAWDIAGRELRSYRQLPQLWYAVQPHLAEHTSTRAGLLGSALSRRLELFGLYPSAEEALAGQQTLAQAYQALWNQLGLSWTIAAAGPRQDAVWLWEHPDGETTLFRCGHCGYVGLPAATMVPPPPPDPSPMLAMEEVETPDCTTIPALAEFLGIPPAATMKVVFYTLEQEDQVVCAVIRGDLNIDEQKLARAVGYKPFRPSTDGEVRWVGSVPGYGSPIGLKRVRVLADPTVMAARNLVAGANREPFHIRNVNAGRDFAVHQVVDLRAVRAGDPCPGCGEPLTEGHGFALGEQAVQVADEAGMPDAHYLDQAGQSHPLVMLNLALELDRIWGVLAEVHRDENGLCWPALAAPVHVHLVAVKLDMPAVAQMAERIYERLQEAGLCVLFDDRDERPGVAFKDADLLGAPLRLTVSPRALEAGGVEVKWRAASESTVVAEEALTSLIAPLLA